MSQVDPEQRTLVQTRQRRGIQHPRIRTVRAAPTAVRQGRGVLRRDAFGEKLLRGQLEHRVQHRPKTAGTRHDADAPLPVPWSWDSFVRQGLLHHHGQFFHAMGGQAANRDVRQLVVIQVGVPVVRGDLRLRTPAHIDLGNGLVSRHTRRRRRHFRSARRLRVACQQHEPQAAEARCITDARADRPRRRDIGMEPNAVSLRFTERNPAIQGRCEGGRTNDQRVGGRAGIYTEPGEEQSRDHTDPADQEENRSKRCEDKNRGSVSPERPSRQAELPGPWSPAFSQESASSGQAGNPWIGFRAAVGGGKIELSGVLHERASAEQTETDSFPWPPSSTNFPFAMRHCRSRWTNTTA